VLHEFVMVTGLAAAGHVCVAWWPWGRCADGHERVAPWAALAMLAQVPMILFWDVCAVRAIDEVGNFGVWASLCTVGVPWAMLCYDAAYAAAHPGTMAPYAALA
jgi:hypothetical protein